ncbi:MAG: MATE family efflux transporter [Pseudomonadales bacterium]|nr:MATE family efflux transporter [Pseudomonadales bacterium]
MTVDRRQIFQIAWPIIISNLSTPLLGLVDTAVIGNLGEAELIGAIAIGGVIFSFLYWGFGFLRMGTTGLVAQAEGAGNFTESTAAFYRAALLGLSVAILLLATQTLLGSMAMSLINASPEVEAQALTYFQIRIWGAPFSLTHLAVMGYLLGTRQTRQLLLLQVILNGTNIILDIVFVMILEWGVAGAAAATVVSEAIVILVGLILVVTQLKKKGHWQVSLALLLDAAALKNTVVVNRDIMIRTLCLIFAFAWFTNEGAKAGDVLLAANAILMQFVSFAAFFLDGFALAAESLVGNATGARDSPAITRVLRYTSEAGLGTALLLSLLFAVGGETAIGLLTNVDEVRRAADHYLIWAVLAPPLSVWCYLLDGAFIGATRTTEMRNAMIVSLMMFLLAWWLLTPLLGNHGLWLSLQVYFLARAASLGFYLSRLTRFPAPLVATGPET